MKNNLIFFAVLLTMTTMVFTACQTAATTDNANKANEEAAAQIVAASIDIWNNQNLAALDATHHADFKRITPNGTVEGVDAYKATFEQAFQTWSDVNLDIPEYWVNDNVITMLWTWSATNTGPLEEGIPATGKSVTVPGMSKITLVDGKVKEDLLYWDRQAMNLELGFTLTPPQLADAGEEGEE